MTSYYERIDLEDTSLIRSEIDELAFQLVITFSGWLTDLGIVNAWAKEGLWH